MLNKLLLIKQLFDCELSELTMDFNKDTFHCVKHRFAENIIVPINAITNNVDFLLCKGEKNVTTADGIKCIVTNWKEVHACELENDIKELYKMDVWSFIKRWYGNDKNTQSLSFVKIELRKSDE